MLKRFYVAILCTFLLIFSIGIAFVVVEFGLKELSKVNPNIRYFTEDHSQPQKIEEILTFPQLVETNFFFLQPGRVQNGFRTNSKGFISPEDTYAKPKNVYRVVLIGDSFGESIVPYKKSFIRILERRLNAQPGLQKKVEVINLSVSGIGLKTYERLLALEAVKYDPDLVIVSIYVGNDLDTEYYNQVGFDFNPAGTQRVHFRAVQLVQNIWTVLTSYVYKPAVIKNDSTVPMGSLAENYDDAHDDKMPTFTEESYQKLLDHKVRLFITGDHLFLPYLDRIKETLNKMSSVAKEKEFPIVYMIIPDEMQTNEQVMELAVSHMPEKRELDRNLPQKELIKLFPEGSLYLDLLPIFLDQVDKENLYQPRDSHTNSYGNSVTATALFEFLWPKISPKLTNQ